MRFDPARLRAPFIVKPAVGFFSLGVHVVASAAAWPAVVDEIEGEVRALGTLYPEQVLDLDHFVVEEVIEGEEFAVDAFYDADGEPTLVNVYAHLFSSADDVSDRVYFTRCRDGRPPGPAGRGVPRGDRPPRRPRRLPRPHRAAHRRRRPRGADRGQPDALRWLVRD